MADAAPDRTVAGADYFPDTRWTLIQRAREDGRGLEEWCRGYWRPVRDYIRARGANGDAADELAQEFFARLLRRGVEHSLPGGLEGSFRAWLRRAVRNFLIDVWRGENSRRCGGGVEHIPAEDAALVDAEAAPDVAFAQAWVVTVMERALSILEKEMESAGRAEFFKAAAGCLDGRDAGTDRRALAGQFGMNEGALRVALHRLRQRYRALIEDEIRQSVSSAEDFQEELRYLLSVWS